LAAGTVHNIVSVELGQSKLRALGVPKYPKKGGKCGTFEIDYFSMFNGFKKNVTCCVESQMTGDEKWLNSVTSQTN
jgi:hypothetical protein